METRSDLIFKGTFVTPLRDFKDTRPLQRIPRDELTFHMHRHLFRNAAAVFAIRESFLGFTHIGNACETRRRCWPPESTHMHPALIDLFCRSAKTHNIIEDEQWILPCFLWILYTALFLDTASSSCSLPPTRIHARHNAKHHHVPSYAPASIRRQLTRGPTHGSCRSAGWFNNCAEKVPMSSSA